MTYNWQQSDWPGFKYNLQEIEDLVLTFGKYAGRISGLHDALPQKDQTETTIDMMVSEALKTSEIEGEYLDRPDIMSSIRNNLGVSSNTLQTKDKKAEGIAELMVDVRNSYAENLTKEKLFSWHKMVMKGTIKAGKWRTHEEPMQVISGPIGKTKIHFEAPPSSQVPKEMTRFIKWFNTTHPNGKEPIKHAPIRSAIAHLYFETIHPFEDGNGRVGRALAEKALSQGVEHPVLISLSTIIEANKKAYYDALKEGQGSNEITGWIICFVKTILDAHIHAEKQIQFTLNKAKFFDRFQGQLNERQLKVVQRMLKEGLKGFKGGLSAKNYMSITGISKATATRDLQDLTDKGVFIPSGGGRSTRYEINFGDGS
jgi:Fic family protein